MNIIGKLKPGDLITVAYNNCTYPAMFHKRTNVSIQFYNISSYMLDSIKKGGITKAHKFYINSPENHYRVVKITEDSLSDEDLVTYKEMKTIYEGISV
jgi:hypothetical protein